MRYFDTHCHLQMDAFCGSINEVLSEMEKARVERAVCIATSLDEVSRVNNIIAVGSGIFGSFALSPQDPDQKDLSPVEIAKVIKDNHYVAVGETGLDYYYFSEPLGWQRERFELHIEAARIAGVPYIIHSRDAAADTLKILSSPSSKGIPFVLHSFAGDWEYAKKALDLGAFISFSGMVTFKNAASIQDAAKKCPLERMFIETDSPYLAPVPFRGQRNTPALVPWAAKKIASLKGVSEEQVARQTFENACKFFSVH